MGAAVGACTLAGLAYLGLRRRRVEHPSPLLNQGGKAADLESGSGHSSSQAQVSGDSRQIEEVIAALSGGSRGSSGVQSGEAEQLMARLLAEAPSPQVRILVHPGPSLPWQGPWLCACSAQPS